VIDRHAAQFELALDNDDERQRPVTRVFRHVLIIARLFQDVIGDVADAHNLHPGDFLVVMTLARRDAPIRPTELFRSLLVTSGAMTKRLDRLFAAGLITRIAPEQDGRSSPVTLTDAGSRIAAAVRAERNAMHDIAELFGIDRLEALDTLLRDYIDAARAHEGRDHTNG
jgi:cytochrome b561